LLITYPDSIVAHTKQQAYYQTIAQSLVTHASTPTGLRVVAFAGQQRSVRLKSFARCGDPRSQTWSKASGL
jgi:hypothetical protein